MSKKRATNYERNLGDRFWKEGFAVMRAPSSSGTSIFPRPDLLVGSSKKKKIFAIELKTARQETFYVTKKQINGLTKFSEIFGAIPILAVKYVSKRLPFLFLKIPDDLIESRGESYVINIEHVTRVGKKLEELISD
ncbi:MAG: Holliday junction resolvase Hjc [Candidatus Heimdallarchaeaceae archaeon]|nr:MAG: hypothetical protein DRN69_07570 [Candidatus Pacearchaeota archaeon]